MMGDYNFAQLARPSYREMRLKQITEAIAS